MCRNPLLMMCLHSRNPDATPTTKAKRGRDGGAKNSSMAWIKHISNESDFVDYYFWLRYKTPKNESHAITRCAPILWHSNVVLCCVSALWIWNRPNCESQRNCGRHRNHLAITLAQPLLKLRSLIKRCQPKSQFVDAETFHQPKLTFIPSTPHSMLNCHFFLRFVSNYELANARQQQELNMKCKFSWND